MIAEADDDFLGFDIGTVGHESSLQDSAGVLQSVASGHDRRAELLHPCVPGRLQSLHFLGRRLGAALRGFAIDEQKLRHDGTPDGFAYAGGGLSPALCEYNEQAATVRTPARDGLYRRRPGPGASLSNPADPLRGAAGGGDPPTGRARVRRKNPVGPEERDEPESPSDGPVPEERIVAFVGGCNPPNAEALRRGLHPPCNRQTGLPGQTLRSRVARRTASVRP